VAQTIILQVIFTKKLKLLFMVLLSVVHTTFNIFEKKKKEIVPINDPLFIGLDNNCTIFTKIVRLKRLKKSANVILPYML